MKTTWSWTTNSMHAIYPIKTLSHACLTPLFVLPQQLAQSLMARTDIHASATPRPARTSTMLIESDIRGGIRGILP